MSWATHKMEVPAWGWAVVGSGAAVAAVVAARRQARQGERRELHLRAAITVQAPAARIYELWREPQTHAQLRRARITPLGDQGTNWRWRRDFTNGGHLEGEIRLTAEQAPQRLEWVAENLQVQLHPGAPLRHLRATPRGLLQLRAQPRSAGTAEASAVRLQVSLEGAPALPWVRARIAAGMQTSLRRLRMLAETGALATTAGQPAGERSRKGRVLLRMLEGPQTRAARKVS